jgi:S1-C subfamily serine protease
VRRRDDLLGLVVPKTVIGVAVWVLMIALGAAVSGLVFFGLYQQRVNRIEERFLGAEQRISKRVDARLGELERRLDAGQGATPGAEQAGRLAERVAPSIAQLEGLDPAGTPTVGSGFVVRSTAGESWILTNYRLVAGSVTGRKPVRVRVADADRASQVFSSDPKRDLALVILKTGGLRSLAWTSADAAVGADVFAAGTSLRPATATLVPTRLADAGADGLLIDEEFFPHLTGGPLLDAEGKVVGVLSTSYAPSGRDPSARWAVPIRAACERVLRCPVAGTRS